MTEAMAHVGTDLAPDPAHVWYPVAVAPPPVGVLVRVIWDGRAPFEAARVAHPRTRRTAWLTHDKGDPVLLPCAAPPPDPRRPWAGWHTLKGERPDHWQPIRPDLWKAPLPPVSVVITGQAATRMWSSTVRSAALDADTRLTGLTGAALADAMEDMREAARVAGDDGAGREQVPERQWWADPHAVTYSEPGRISRREAEGRLMRALAAERWVRVDRPRCRTSAEVIAGMAARTFPADVSELAAQDPEVVRPEPTGRDQDDMLIALGWALCLPAPYQRVIRLRAGMPPLSWAEIGDKIDRSATTAQARYRAAIDAVTAAANAGTVGRAAG